MASSRNVPHSDDEPCTGPVHDDDAGCTSCAEQAKMLSADGEPGCPWNDGTPEKLIGVPPGSPDAICVLPCASSHGQ